MTTNIWMTYADDTAVYGHEFHSLRTISLREDASVGLKLKEIRRSFFLMVSIFQEVII